MKSRPFFPKCPELRLSMLTWITPSIAHHALMPPGVLQRSYTLPAFGPPYTLTSTGYFLLGSKFTGYVIVIGRSKSPSDDFTLTISDLGILYSSKASPLLLPSSRMSLPFASTRAMVVGVERFE